MIANNNNIGKALGIPFTPENNGIKPYVEPIVIQSDNEEQTTAELDYDFARTNIREVIDTGKKAVDELLEFAKQSQSARAYEVLATTISTVVDANQKLLNLSKQIKEIKKVESGSTPEQAPVNQNLFITTDTLAKMLKGIDLEDKEPEL